MKTIRSNRQNAATSRPTKLSSISLLLCVCIHIHGGVAFCPTVLPAAAAAALSQRHSPSPLSKHAQYPSSRHITNAVTSISSSSSVNSKDDLHQSSRSKLRQLTGLSLTAIRSTLRAATGFSLTTFRATLRAATGISLSEVISVTLRQMLGILSPSLRCFLQPLLVMYYAPLLMVRYWMVGPSKKYVEESRSGHEKLIEGWRKVVQAAEKAHSNDYWPVHLNDDGTIVIALPPDYDDVDLADGIEMSMAAISNSSDTVLACES